MSTTACLCFSRYSALTERGYVVQVDPPAGTPGRRVCPLRCGASFRVWVRTDRLPILVGGPRG